MAQSATFPAVSNQTKGILLMVLALLTIPMVDGLAKYLSATYSPLFISWVRYAVASLIVLPFAAGIHGRRVFPSEQIPAHFIRTVLIIGSMSFYFLAVAQTALATAISASFVAPIVAVVLSILVLRERLTTRKVLSLLLGIAGSLVILQPGGTIDTGVLLAMGAGTCYAFYMIASRRAAQKSDPVKMLAFQCVVGAALLTPQAIVFWSLPTAHDMLLFGALGLCSAISHILAIFAFRLAESSTLAPILYVELIGAALIGFIFFHEIPTMATIAGAVLIILGGLVLVQRRAVAPPL